MCHEFVHYFFHANRADIIDNICLDIEYLSFPVLQLLRVAIIHWLSFKLLNSFFNVCVLVGSFLTLSHQRVPFLDPNCSSGLPLMLKWDILHSLGQIVS